MKKILIIQSRAKPEMVASEQAGYTKVIGDRAELSFVSTIDLALPWNEPEKIIGGFSGIIFGGSGDFDFDGGRNDSDPARVEAHAIRDRLKPLVICAFEKKIPMLGICFGHQIIAEVHNTRVHSDPLQKKVGSHAVTLTTEGKGDQLFENFPETFVGQYGHKDSLSSLPEGAVLLATGDNCKFSALRYSPYVYTLQFHPELTAEETLWKLQNSPGYLPEGVDPKSLVKDSKEASTIIPTFVEKIIDRGA
jgi:GMP synthase (glutamine-hydrolysing)